jgi:predicted HTH transcriptional regulator
LEDVSLVAIDTTYILESNAQVSDTTRFRFLHAMGKKMATYFRNETEKTTHELIQELESEYLEFKSSIDFNNWNAMVRTVAGFMNLNGGTILCGVKDGGGAHTTFKTNRNDVDEFERKFRDLLIKHLGEAIPAVRVDYIENQNQHIVRIDVEPSTQPIFYTDTNKESQKREYFYIRTGNQNHPILFPSDIINYIQKRFKFNTQP